MMAKFKAYPVDDLEMNPHTWTKGLDYELIQKDDYFTLASNEGQTNITGLAVDKMKEIFNFESH